MINTSPETAVTHDSGGDMMSTQENHVQRPIDRSPAGLVLINMLNAAPARPDTDTSPTDPFRFQNSNQRFLQLDNESDASRTPRSLEEATAILAAEALVDYSNQPAPTQTELDGGLSLVDTQFQQAQDNNATILKLAHLKARRRKVEEHLLQHIVLPSILHIINPQQRRRLEGILQTEFTSLAAQLQVLGSNTTPG